MKRSKQAPKAQPIRPLQPADLAQVIGGSHEIVSPRDPATGLPTGK